MAAKFREKNVAAGFSLRKIALFLPYLEAQPKGCGYMWIAVSAPSGAKSLIYQGKQFFTWCET
jgi:hypothetical protein